MRGSKSAVVSAVAVLVMTILVACGSSSPNPTPTPPPPAAAIVTLRNIAFTPNTVTIMAGQTVAWKFDDGTIVHNVTGAGWHSADLDTGYYTHTFTTPGTYQYVCTIHSGMDGTVVVTPATPATVSSPTTTAATNSSASSGPTTS